MKIKDVMEGFRKETLFFKVTHLPIKRWLNLTFFLLTLSERNRNSSDEYFTFYYQVLAYSYCCSKLHDVTLLMDHGLVQQMGSILHNMDFAASDKTLRKFRCFLKSMQPIKIVYCKISEMEALERMRGRRRDSGRIDAVMNNTECAMALLKKERELFENVYFTNKDLIKVLDMSRSSEVITKDISVLLSET